MNSFKTNQEAYLGCGVPRSTLTLLAASCEESSIDCLFLLCSLTPK